MIRAGDLQAMWFLLGGFALPHWRITLRLVAASIAAAALGTIQPLVLAPALDSTITSGTRPAGSVSDLTLNNLGPTILELVDPDLQSPTLVILVVAVLYMLVGAGVGVLTFLSARLSVQLRVVTILDMQRALFRHLLELPMSFHTARRSGELVSRMTDDVAGVANTFEPIVRGMLQSGIQIVFYGLVLVRTEAVLSASVLIVSLLHLVTTRLLHDRLRDRTVENSDVTADMRTTMQEGLLSIRVVKTFAAERFEMTKLDAVLSRLRGTWRRLGTVQSMEDPLRRFTDAVAIGLVLIVAFRALAAGSLSIAGFALFIYIARSAIVPVSAFASSVVSVYGFLGCSTRIMELFRTTTSLPDGTLVAQRFSQAIRIEHVSFEYEPGRRVLDDVTFDVHKGEVVALVGASGAGKSTVVDLALRLYDPTEGRVTFDGTDIRELDVQGYRRQFGVVPQDSLLFNVSVAENIAYGRTLDLGRVRRAATLANAAGFIQELPHDYATLVGDRGIRLSGGERQRIAIARALYDEPAILIFDEATSALDAESEFAVQLAIENALAEVTGFVIAHRLSTIVRADKIVLLRGGRVEAIGGHTSLLRENAHYRRLYESQMVEARA